MAMGTVQAANILTGTPERAKYFETGTITEIWKAHVTTALANTDTISGPILPAGCYLLDLVVDWDDVDSATSITFEAGYATALAAFIATGNTTPRTGGIVHANVAGTVGFTAATDTTILVTITATAGTPVAGDVRIALSYTANP